MLLIHLVAWHKLDLVPAGLACFTYLNHRSNFFHVRMVRAELEVKLLIFNQKSRSRSVVDSVRIASYNDALNRLEFQLLLES